MKSIVDYLGVIERKFTRFSLTILLALLGAKAAGSYFIHSPIVRRTQARILWFHEQVRSRKGQGAADAFVFDYLSARPRVQDYSNLLVGTGGNRPSTDKVAEALPATMKTAAKSAEASVALVSTLLDRGDIELALKVITEHMNDARVNASVDWPSLLLSLTPRPLFETGTPVRGLSSVKDLKPQPSKSRLIIMDEELSPAAIRSLAGGAEKITLLQYRDLYGRIDLSAIQAEIPDCEINVEHARSRVDRFHQRYFELHQKTLGAAEALTKNFIDNTHWLGELVPALEGFGKDLTLDLADKLFFKALRLEGIYRAVLDQSFDSVIVSFGEGFELYRLFYSDSALWRDPRITGCCRSRKIKTVTKFASRVSEMRRHASVGSTSPILAHIASLKQSAKSGANRSSPETVRRYLEACSKVSAPTTPSHRNDRQTIAFVAQEGRAYGPTAIQMATHLHSNYNVDVILTLGSATGLQKSLASAQMDPFLAPAARGRQPGYLKLAAPPPNGAATKALSDQFNLTLGETAKELLWGNQQDPAVSSAIDFMLTDGLAEAILKVMGNARAVAALLERQNYSAIAISPVRTPRNAQFTTLAREANVPTIAVEPHCLNAAYCRYGTIPSDYAAVYSDYYAQEYGRFFGIAKNRCFPFGSPRILRRIGYDPIASRKDARQRIGLYEGDPPVIAVPTQPMPADHILAVWRLITRAVIALDMPVRVILKPHPEEGSGHVERYRQVIIEENATHLCFVADVDIKDLLIASELVLTGYSVTALEAVVLERNVAIVGREGVAYPTEYDKILGIPFCGTEQETKDAILEAMTLGRDAKSGAKDFMAKNPHLFDNSTFDRLTTIVEDVIAKGPEGIRSHEDLPSSLFVTAPFHEYLV